MSSTVPASFPRHIAIIMDGNNRYGRREGLGLGQGHVAGRDNLDVLIEHLHDRKLEVLTIFAFSSENWQRPPEEVHLLMTVLLAATIDQQLPKLKRKKVALRFIGDRSLFKPEIRQKMEQAEQETQTGDTVMTLVVALSYGGMWDMANAAREMALKVQAGTLDPASINEHTIAQHIQMNDLPPVDLLIRTGGDFRISNFLFWQAAYAELYFTPTLWPEFSATEMDKAIEEFGSRQRRFGRTSEQVEADSLG